MFYAGHTQSRGYRPMMFSRGAGMSGLGALGDIPIAAWPAGTLLQYSNTHLAGNTWLSYTNEEIQAAFAASGLFVPTTVVFHAENVTFLGIGNDYKVSLQGVLPVAVNQSDAAKVIEGLLANWFVTNPTTAVYYPPASTTQDVSSTTGKTTSPPSTLVPSTIQQSGVTAASRGIVSAGQYADGSTYVATSDGNILNFDDQGDPLFGVPVGSYGVSFGIAYDDGTTGVVMTDETEFIFDANGKQVLPGGSILNNLNNAIQTVKTTNTNPGATPPPGKKSPTDEILDALGLSKVPLSLGVGGGVVLVGLGIAAYLIASKK